MKSKNMTTDCPQCDIGSLTRNNYFTGKLLVERDFKDEQRYYVDKLRLHQKRLHGEGVVCGLQVKQYSNQACLSRYLSVQPGFAKDCCGNDIIVPAEETVDLTQFKSWMKLQAAQSNPSSGRASLATSHTLQICVRYRECPTENIPVLYDDCGCDDNACAPNRILESYEFDLLVDPAIKPRRGCLPQIAAAKALNGVTPGLLAFDPNDTYLYAVSSATPATLYQMDPTGQTVIASQILPAAGKALAVSDDGKQVYVVLYDSVGGKSSLVVLSASGLGVTGTSAGVADDANPASLAVLPSSKVAWLQTLSAQFLIWDVSTATPTQSQAIALTGSPVGLALGADRTKGYYIDQTNKQVGVVDISGGATLAPITLVANPIEVVLAASSGPDVLAVIDSTNGTITAIQANPVQEVASIALLYPPLASAADPQKKVLYVVTSQPASGTNPVTYQLQPFDLKKLVGGSPELPPAGTPSVQPAGPTAVVTDGHSVFVIGAQGNINNPTRGYTIAAQGCAELYTLEDCEDCCQADCLVLATIRGYQPGFQIEDPPTPPSDPLTDYNSQIARIDNKLGRVILPSTRKIAEVLESITCGCACDCQSQVTTVPAPVTTTPPVIGLNPNLPKIIDIGWQHGATVTYAQFEGSLYYQAPPPPLGQTLPILTIYFDQVMKGVDRQSFRVELTYPQMGTAPPFTGMYNSGRLVLYGVLLDLVPLGINITPNTNEIPKSAWAFIPYNEFWTSINLSGVFDSSSYNNPSWPALDLPVLRITLSGNFVYAGPNYAESGVLDGDNIGGQVGLNQARGGSITGGKNPSGDMVEGGTFESWFYLQAPAGYSVPIGGLTHLNQATAAQLQKLPGVDEALATKIVEERKANKFVSLGDLQKRLNLSDATVKGLARLTIL